jgi:hypothetical protein
MPTMLPSKRLPVIINKAAPASFYDSISIAGVVQVWPIGTTILWYVRPLLSRVPVINGNAGVVLTPPDNQGNNARYDWTAGDILVCGEGDFVAWWNFTMPGFTAQETPEFPIYISDHGPGLGTQTGAIVQGAYAFMPITLDALRRDVRFGDLWLQNQSQVIQVRVLGTFVTPDQEETAYELVLLDWLSKRLALQLIKPGIEYWSRQVKTATTTQTSEVTSYPDMIASLKDLEIRLIAELAQEWRDLLVIVPGLPQRRVTPMPAVINSGSIVDPNNLTWDFVTGNPRANQRLLTGGWGWGLDFGVWPFP